MLFWEQFFMGSIFDSGSFTTDLNDDEIVEKLRENIEDYLGEDKHFTSKLIEFYLDTEQLFEELPEELRICIALKEIESEMEMDSIIIKEIIV